MEQLKYIGYLGIVQVMIVPEIQPESLLHHIQVSLNNMASLSR